MNLDLVTPAFKTDPYPTFARLRNESPVVATRLPDSRQAWLVLRYDDVALALKDSRFAKDRRRVSTQHRLPFERFIAPLIRPLQFNMLDLDAPDHTRLRALLHKAFTPRLIERLRERIQALAEDLIDRASHRQRFDLPLRIQTPVAVSRA